MTVKECMDGDVVLVRHISANDAWSGPLQFFSRSEEFVQVGTWNYNSGKKLLAHTHKIAPRSFERTQEVLYICKGKIRAHVYNRALEKVDEIIASEGDVLVMLSGGHGYDILEDDTRVLEIKNGPYVGPEADRVRLSDLTT